MPCNYCLHLYLLEATHSLYSIEYGLWSCTYAHLFCVYFTICFGCNGRKITLSRHLLLDAFVWLFLITLLVFPSVECKMCTCSVSNCKNLYRLCLNCCLQNYKGGEKKMFITSAKINQFKNFICNLQLVILSLACSRAI